jgi:hypothetical protein
MKMRTPLRSTNSQLKFYQITSVDLLNENCVNSFVFQQLRIHKIELVYRVQKSVKKQCGSEHWKFESGPVFMPNTCAMVVKSAER